jgi:hypothetical protein
MRYTLLTIILASGFTLLWIARTYIRQHLRRRSWLNDINRGDRVYHRPTGTIQRVGCPPFCGKIVLVDACLDRTEVPTHEIDPAWEYQIAKN